MSGDRITRTRSYALIVSAFAKLPDSFRAEFAAAFAEFAPQLLAHERAGVPIRSGTRPSKFAASRSGSRPAGGLASLLSTATDNDGLTLRSGLLTKQAQSDGFYGYILDAGRGQKGNRSKAASRQLPQTTGGRFGSVHTVTRPYTRAISPIDPGRYDITFGRVRQWARDEMGPLLNRVADRALRAIAWGD